MSNPTRDSSAAAQPLIDRLDQLYPADPDIVDPPPSSRMVVRRDDSRTDAVKVTPLDIPGALLIDPSLFRDRRGLFCETFHAQRYVEAGLNDQFVQDNFSRSVRGTLRGLHYQQPHAQENW